MTAPPETLELAEDVAGKSLPASPCYASPCGRVTLYLGDCLERMTEIPDGSVDMVCADPPYGTTACKWDTVIPFEPMWQQLKRIAKPNGAIVMTASQPFTSALVMSNVAMFKYCWTWKKNFPTGMAFANFQPMRVIEEVVVFAKGKTVFNKQMIDCSPSVKKAWKDGQEMNLPSQVGVYSEHMTNVKHKVRHKINPVNFLDIKCVNRSTGTVHPTQKPVALMEYLIRTYTNEGETVLDFTMGSGTTGVACIRTGRRLIGIEKDPTHYATAVERITNELAQGDLFLRPNVKVTNKGSENES